ncbi:hypothetical protein K501DRAFT_99640 [Backusella circina FSU 941]|nr:hypothetical protein K501DRAFT_99640 [Backusella circina FSU 941]
MNNNYQAGYMQQPQQQRQRNNVDLYEWDEASNDKEIVTSTPSAQLLADEELARQLAREEEGESIVEPFSVPREVNDDNSANHEEVTFTAPDKPIETTHTPPVTTTTTSSPATIPNKPNQVVDDDLDDLFDKKVDLNDDGADKTK